MKRVTKITLIFLVVNFFLILGVQSVSANEGATGATPAFVESLNSIFRGCTAIDEAKTAGQVHYWNDERCNTPAGQAEVRQETPFAQVMGLTETMYTTPPSSAMVWAEDQYNKIIGNGTVYAQEPGDVEYYRPGLGVSLLQPIQGFWAWSRNIAYLAFIILIIIVAFLILFRNNLGGQTPITIFNSIPTMILSLVLITFSYPISGLFVDVVTVGSNLIQNLVLSGPGAPGETLWDEDAEWRVNPFKSGSQPAKGTVGMKDLQPDDPAMSLWSIMNTANPQVCKQGESCDLSDLVPENLGVPGGMFGQLIEVLLHTGINITGNGGILGLIFAFAAFTAAFKLFFALLNKYLVLVIGTIISPWYFFFAAIPSKTGSFITDFLKIHLGAAITFVAIYGLFLFLVVFSRTSETFYLSWIPPMMGYDPNTIIHGGLINFIIVYGIFLTTPLIPQLIDKFLDIPEGNVIAQNIGQQFSGGAKNMVGYGSTLIKSSPIGNQLNQLRGQGQRRR